MTLADVDNASWESVVQATRSTPYQHRVPNRFEQTVRIAKVVAKSKCNKTSKDETPQNFARSYRSYGFTICLF